jgi:hypothetical protein
VVLLGSPIVAPPGAAASSASLTLGWSGRIVVDQIYSGYGGFGREHTEYTLDGSKVTAAGGVDGAGSLCDYPSSTPCVFTHWVQPVHWDSSVHVVQPGICGTTEDGHAAGDTPLDPGSNVDPGADLSFTSPDQNLSGI